MFKRLVYTLMLLLILTGCQPPQPTFEAPPPSPAQSSFVAKYSPTFEQTECGYIPPDQLDYVLQNTNSRVECGNLIVPEDRSKLDSPTIKLAVIIYKSTGTERKPDPVLFLWTSPTPQAEFSLRYPYFLADLLKEHDFIVPDLRGVGQSEPAFNCPDLSATYYQDIEEDPLSDVVNQHLTDTYLACYQKWAAQSASLASYSTEDIAADIEDLRQALGYEKWDIFAVAYGSRLAYYLMNYYPQTVRSLVLDSHYPLNDNPFAGQALTYERMLNMLFDNCAADEKCKAAFPDLKRTFFLAVDQLNSHPTTVEVKDLQGGGRYQMTLSGARMVDLIAISMGYNVTQFIPELPRMIYQVSRGEYAKFTELIGNLIPYYEPAPGGMYGRITCAEYILPMSPNEYKETNKAADPRVSEYLNRQYELNYLGCQQLWKEFDGKVKPLTLKGNSSVPVLILQGEQNHLISTESSKALAKELGSATYIEMAQTGSLDWMFGNSKTDCIKPILTDFINDPSATIDASCAATRTTTLWITLP